MKSLYFKLLFNTFQRLEQKMAFLNENLVPSRQRYRELTEKNKANASEVLKKYKYVIKF